jgi:hypothetical protein
LFLLVAIPGYGDSTTPPAKTPGKTGHTEGDGHNHSKDKTGHANGGGHDREKEGKAK